MTAKQRITEVAQSNGWNVEPGVTNEGRAVGNDLRITKGRREFYVEINSRGSVIASSRPGGFVIGKDKAGQIERLLEA